MNNQTKFNVKTTLNSIMSIIYEPTSFDFDKKRIYFSVKNGRFKIDTYVSFEKSQDMSLYEGVNRYVHFRDEMGNIVNISDCPTRLMTIRDGETFIKARQWEYDRWMKKLYPYSVNATIYDKISKMKFVTSIV